MHNAYRLGPSGSSLPGDRGVEIAHLLAGGAHCASWSLVGQSLESRFQPVKRQLKKPITATGIVQVLHSYIHSFLACTTRSAL